MATITKTKTGKPTWNGDVQVVREPTGSFSIYFHAPDLPGAWVFHVKKNGTVTPGNLRRLERLFES